MPKPRDRSASLEIIPPTNTRAPGLADVMAAAFHANHRENEANNSSKDLDDEEDADAEADEIDDDLAPEQPKHESTNKAPPPKGPMRCERCVRTNKPCPGGMIGQRCDNCKRLKQKCSNSIGGPVRNKNASTNKAAGSADRIKNGETISKAGPSTTPKSAIKRKVTPAINGDVDGHSADGEGSIDEESGNQASRQRKKRRISNGLTRAQLVKTATDMEAAINRLQTSVEKELDKMRGVVSTLNSRIKDMEEA